MKFIFDVKWRQFIHLLLSLQGTRDGFLRALIKSSESATSKRFFQLKVSASSIALIAPEISSCKAFPRPVYSLKQSRNSKLLFLNIPPQDDKFPLVEPLVLHLVQIGGGGCHMTSITLGGIGGCSLNLTFSEA